MVTYGKSATAQGVILTNSLSEYIFSLRCMMNKHDTKSIMQTFCFLSEQS